MSSAVGRVGPAVVAGLCLLLSGFSVAQGGAPVVWPDVTLDQRDYQGNIQATDRHWFYEDSRMHPPIEFPANPPVVHVLYMQGENIVVKVRWKNTNSFALSGTLTWQAARLEAPGPSAAYPGPYYVDLVVPTNPINITLPPNGGTFETTLTLTGTPEYVAVGGLQVKFDMPLTDGEGWGNNGTNGNYAQFERVCMMRSVPLSLMSVPWADLAEYSCRWAYGYSSYEEVRRGMTVGMNRSGYSPWNMNLYDPGTAAYWGGNSINPVKLSVYLNDIGDCWFSVPPTRVAYLDCRGFTAILKFALAIHGIWTTSDRIERASGFLSPSTGFSTWPLCPAGTPSNLLANYNPVRFNFHYALESDYMRYDAAVSYRFDLFGVEWWQPAYDWIADIHWQSPANGFYWGLCYDSWILAVYPWADNTQQNENIQQREPVTYE